jgi:hypothetical protein
MATTFRISAHTTNASENDIDFFYEKSAQNCKQLFVALMEYWDQDIPGIATVTDLRESCAIFQFGVPPNRIDLINQIDGVNFENA